METSGGQEAQVIDLSAGRGPVGEAPRSVVLSATRGDHRAFGKLVELYDERLRALAYHMLGSREAMDDALQETYLNAYRGLPQLRSEAGIGAWLYRITYNTCLQRLRRRERLQPTDDGRLEELAPPVPDFADDVVLRDELHRALLELTPEQCAALLLVHRDGFSYAAAAEILQVPIGTVASRVAAARAALGRALTGHRSAREAR